MEMGFRQKTSWLWEMEPKGSMQVPARVIASRRLWEAIRSDESLSQLCNVASLPGIVEQALAMPDIHAGYGFPIGGVAAFREEDGILSPGGVGYDINCGVRVAITPLKEKEIHERLPTLIEQLFLKVPSGVGAAHAIPKLSHKEMQQVVIFGAEWAVKRGFGTSEDLTRTEEGGRLSGTDPDTISERAYTRGREQLGTLGSGNHFVEVDIVDEIYDEATASRMGLFPTQGVVQIHCGSRGFGHQICEDFLSLMLQAARRYGITLPDRQLACAPLDSPEGKKYLKAMNGAANFAWANRQIILHKVREAFCETWNDESLGRDIHLLYDVCHNIAKMEEHKIGKKILRLCVHRKGATRAFGPGHPAVPEVYRDIGQPVLIPGDMGRYSFILTGASQAMVISFGSSCHGAGRTMSRRQAKKIARTRRIEDELEKQGIIVRGASKATVDEEIPEAYKDVAEVVEAIAQAGISRKIARLRPVGVVKG